MVVMEGNLSLGHFCVFAQWPLPQCRTEGQTFSFCVPAPAHVLKPRAILALSYEVVLELLSVWCLLMKHLSRKAGVVRVEQKQILESLTGENCRGQQACKSGTFRSFAHQALSLPSAFTFITVLDPRKRNIPLKNLMKKHSELLVNSS